MKRYSVAILALLLVLPACSSSSSTSAPTTVAMLQKNVALPTTTLVKVFTPTTLNSSCVAAGPCLVGQRGPAGGIVFLAAASPQAWGQYMEVKPELFGTMVADWCPNVPFLGGAIGDGLKQINNAVKACSNGVNKPEQNAKLSAFIVDAYTQNGFSDWFIPSKSELVELAKSKVISIPTNLDISSYSYYDDPSFLGYAATWGFRGDAMQRVGYAPSYNMSVLADGGATYGDLKIRNGQYYIARAFGPATPPPSTTVASTTTIKRPTTTTIAPPRR